MRQKAVSLFLCYLVLYTCGCCGEEDRKRRSEENSDSSFWGMVTYMAVGGGLMAAALPMLGFASTGIAANSVASSLMSWSAVANGGGVPAGGLVATLQSLVLDDKSPKKRPKKPGPFSERAAGRQPEPQPRRWERKGASGGSALMAKIGAFLGYTVHRQVESRQKEKE